MSRQLFETWILDPDLNVMSQDEDLIIGVGGNLDLLDEFIIREDAATGKRAMLLSAICVVLFDNIFDPADPNDESNPEFASKAETILRRNIALFDLINEDVISDYIKEVVYPVIGRELPTKP
jgi:hypothetical protein